MAPVRASTFNVRYDDPADEYPWDERRSRVLETIDRIGPDLLGCQEALAHQYDDLRDGLEAYDWHGVGRRDGERAGEFVPVAWRRSRFERLETGAFWLSETPAEPSVGWDASLPRVATWVRLRDRESDETVWFCSVHFDHSGERARLESARLLRRRATDRLERGDVPVVTGDANCTVGSVPHRTLTTGPLADARRVANERSGPAGTFRGFDDGVGDRIDYVFVPSAVDVRRYRTIPPNEATPRSDHLPVVADLELEE
ncbi:endonuclease/exonuclease/phosphatase family protein [Natronococcus sp. A-GB7]|uniref:endonuclease/exonuclease/phosphatase family protein n=1 Tax=Natronococcus sp. A-GB7 TaxID=3037649 RepID=UPI00241CFC52|nr:endonuclease/exonuclease/phosphatase family protein [Natronococcus sp. A-GB7]MDG5820836.1 endonuclease/exonuclease/phosphatase family protein [Natronococcus sp. A-GB7]